MAVLPTAGRTLWRPPRPPWLVAALAILTITLTVPIAAVLLNGSGSAGSFEPIPDTWDLAQTSREAPGGPKSTEGASGPRLLTLEQERALFEAMASDVRLAIDEAAFATESAPSSASETREEPGQSAGMVAEVSAEPVRIASDEPVAEVGGAEVTEPANGVPAAAASQPAVQGAPPSIVQAAPIAGASPVERWASAGVMIETQGQALDDLSLANMDAALNSLPPSVIANLGNPALGPLHILVNTEGRVLSGDQPYGGPANFFSTNEATNELVLYPQQSLFTIVHELGHAYNLRRTGAGRYAMVLMDPEMRSFLDATGWQITSTDAQISAAVDHLHVGYSYSGSFHWERLSNDDPLEDFANSFAMYFLDPSSLQQMSPERYAWMALTFGR